MHEQIFVKGEEKKKKGRDKRKVVHPDVVQIPIDRIRSIETMNSIMRLK